MPVRAGKSRPGLADLRAFYRTDEEIALTSFPAGTSRLVARTAQGDVEEAAPKPRASLGCLRPGTYSVEALSPEGRILAEEITTVGAHPGERPVHGFATSFDVDSVPDSLEWLKALRCTVVQIYDWMATYSAPLGPAMGWKDPSNRDVSFEALRALASGTRSNGAVAHAYAPVYAVDPAFATEHPELLMYRGDGGPERLFENIFLAHPGDPRWQSHFVTAYGGAADAIGFDGFHIDTYGFPRAALTRDGARIDMREAYRSFLDHLRGARPQLQISFNQVNGVPSAMWLPPGPGFRYCEVWPPNDQWRHLEGLLDRSAGLAGRSGAVVPPRPTMRGTIACYPPVWGGDGEGGDAPGRENALRTVTLTEAIATCLGASALLYGDVFAALCDPYYPKHARLSVSEVATVLAWHRFALRCRDLFLDGEDTSWYEIGDENGAVALDWDGPVRPEPIGQAVFGRVVRADDWIAVAIVDLSGSANGRWSEPTSPGRCRAVVGRLLLDRPELWSAEVAVLGQDGDHFVPVPLKVVDHREGLAAQVEVPVVAGWSVLRMRRR